MTRPHCVQLVAGLVRRPEHGAGLAQLAGHALRAVPLHQQVLVDLTRAPAEL